MEWVDFDVSDDASSDDGIELRPRLALIMDLLMRWVSHQTDMYFLSLICFRLMGQIMKLMKATLVVKISCLFCLQMKAEKLL